MPALTTAPTVSNESLKVLELTPSPKSDSTAHHGYASKQCNSGAQKLQNLLYNTNELIVCPGVYDGLSARVAINTGFNAMYMVRLPRPITT